MRRSERARGSSRISLWCRSFAGRTSLPLMARCRCRSLSSSGKAREDRVEFSEKFPMFMKRKKWRRNFECTIRERITKRIQTKVKGNRKDTSAKSNRHFLRSVLCCSPTLMLVSVLDGYAVMRYGDKPNEWPLFMVHCYPRPNPNPRVVQ